MEDVPLNTSEGLKLCEELENDYLCQELATMRVEKEGMLAKYDMLKREKDVCVQSWKELMAKKNELLVEKETWNKKIEDMAKKMKCEAKIWYCRMGRMMDMWKRRAYL